MNRHLTKLRTVAAASLLLVATVAGSASAGVLITSKDIKDETVTGADIRSSGLTGRDVKDGALSPLDILGPEQGPAGEVGATGLPGANGIPGVLHRESPRTLPSATHVSWTVHCDPGTTAVAGGVATSRPDLVTITRSFPDGFHWSLGVENNHVENVRSIGWAVCVPVP
jgi:hypothetical protein